MWPLMNSEVILYSIKNLCHHNVSINRNGYQNLFINENARKKKLKSRSLESHGVPDFFYWDIEEELTFFMIRNQLTHSEMADPLTHDCTSETLPVIYQMPEI